MNKTVSDPLLIGLYFMEFEETDKNIIWMTDNKMRDPGHIDYSKEKWSQRVSA
jgi:hypothetical protein